MRQLAPHPHLAFSALGEPDTFYPPTNDNIGSFPLHIVPLRNYPENGLAEGVEADRGFN